MGIPDEIETRGVTPPHTHTHTHTQTHTHTHTHTHTRVVSSLFSKSVLDWRGGGCLQYDTLEILNFVGVFSNNCGTSIPNYAY